MSSNPQRDRHSEIWSEQEWSVDRRSHYSSEPWGPWRRYEDGFDEYPSFTRRCVDVVGYRNRDNPLLISQSSSNLARSRGIVREISQWTPERHLEREYRFDYGSRASAYLPNGGTLTDDDIEFVTRAAAETNPSASEFDVPIFVAELRDVPSLLKNVGSKLSKYGASEYLKYQYGWKPFVRDVQNLVKGVDKLDRIFNNVKRLRSGDILRRRYGLPSSTRVPFSERYTAESISNTPWGDWGIRLEDNVAIDGYIERWCVLRYQAEAPEGLPDSASGQLALAKKIAYGMTIDGSTAWELMPWSWLLDWCTNTSEYIRSQRNTLGVKVVDSTLMRHTVAKATVTPSWSKQLDPLNFYSMSGFAAMPGEARIELKERFVGVKPQAVSTGEVSLIKGDFTKQSILGALALQRLRRLPI